MVGWHHFHNITNYIHMNKIKSLLRNIKARTVSFFKAPYNKFYQSLWDSIHDQTVCLVSDKLENDQEFIDLESKVDRLEDETIKHDDFDYELCQAYSFTELEERVDSLEANNENDLSLETISDESHPISQLVDDRTEQIHSMISELSDRVDEPYEPNIKYLVSELQKAVQDEADISVFAYLVESLYNKVADNG